MTLRSPQLEALAVLTAFVDDSTLDDLSQLDPAFAARRKQVRADVSRLLGVRWERTA